MSAAPAPAARRAPRWRPLGLGALGVGAYLAAFPPWGAWPLAFVALAPLTSLALEAPTGGRAFLRLYLAGLALFLLGSLWLAETAWINLGLVTVVEALFLGAYGWAARRLLAARAMMPTLPLLWVGLETLRTHWPLSGYPWQQLGLALAQSELLVQAADLGGLPLLSFVAACGGAAGLGLRRGELRGARAGAACVALALVYGLVRPATLGEARPGPTVATVQPGFSQRLKESSARAEERYRRSMDLSQRALAGEPRVDLLVWPETAWPYPLGEGGAEDRWMEGFGMRQSRAWFAEDARPLLADGPLGERAPHLLLGVVHHRLDADGRLQTANSAVYFDAQGNRLGRYDKHILVPGGEAIPFGRLLPEGLRRLAEGWIRSVAGFVIDLEPGPGPAVLELGDVPFGVTICYENAYGDYGRRIVADGAAFLVNLSNEAWFGTSTEFDHMELQSILRAVETRRALVRCTYSGITCLVRPDGRAPSGRDRLVVDGRDRAVAGAFRTAVPLHDDATLYVLVGDAGGWLCLLVAAFLARPSRRTPVS